MLECPLYNSIRDKFEFLFENIALGNVKPFFQLDHQVDVSLYLVEAMAICYSRELTSLIPSRCTFSPWSFLASHFICDIFGENAHYEEYVASPCNSTW